MKKTEKIGNFVITYDTEFDAKEFYKRHLEEIEEELEEIELNKKEKLHRRKELTSIILNVVTTILVAEVTIILGVKIALELIK